MTEPPVEGPGRPFEGPLEGPPQGPGEGQPQGPGEGLPQGPGEGLPGAPFEGLPQGPGEGLPGAPFEGLPQAQFERVTELPPELIVKVIEYLPLETLRSLRMTSPAMATRVDTYLKNLMNYGVLTDRRGAKPDWTTWTPGEALNAWKAGDLQTNYQPPSEANLSEILERFDATFADTDGREFLIWDYELTFEAGAVEPQTAEEVEEQKQAQKLDDDLYFYFQRLIAEGRLVDTTTQEPLPTGTPVGVVLERLKNGFAEWIPPNPNT